MVVNFKTKKKCKAILGVIRILVLDLILYFITRHILYEKVPYICNEHRVKHQIHCASLEEVSKEKL